jgi:hypothetical protein
MEIFIVYLLRALQERGHEENAPGKRLTGSFMNI